MHNFVYNYREIEYYSEKLWKEKGFLGTNEDSKGLPAIQDCPVVDFRTGSEYISDYELDYGKDTLLLYDQFVGFANGSMDEDSYEEKALDGVFNFLKKLARTVDEHKDSILQNDGESQDSYTFRQQMILSFSAPVEKKHKRAYVALLMEYCNELYQLAVDGQCTVHLMKDYLAFLSVLAPRHAENAWQTLELAGSIFESSWPKLDEDFAKEGEVIIPVQVNGKTKCELSIHRNASEEEAKKLALEKLAATGEFNLSLLENGRFIYVAGKIINILNLS